MSIIIENLTRLKSLLPNGVTLVAISKTKPIEDIFEAYNAGHKIFGENKVQELVHKFALLPNDIRWHLVGHLQTNKVKHIAPFVSMIQSVDSIKLLEEISKRGKENKRKISVLCQVYIAKEDSKFGLDEKELEEICEYIKHFSHVELCGLMCMATNTEDMKIVRNEFKCLKSLFDKIKAKYFSDHSSFKEISMGMSGDYSMAIEEGSTMVRVGSSIFGER